MDNLLVVFAEKCFRRRTNAKSLLKLFASAVCYPCNLGSKALNVVLFLLEQAFGDKHRHTNVFVSRFLEHTVKNALNILPDSIAVGSYNHTALNACVLNKLSLFADVCVPLSEILVHRGNGVNHFFIILSHNR